MKFSEMTKEQKQYAVLGVLVGVALMVGLSQFVLAPLQTKLAGARRELDDLTDKIHRAERLIKSEETLRVNVRESTEQLNLATRKYIPDADNPLSWATQVLYEQARAVGIDIQSVSEAGSSSVLSRLVEAGDVNFGSYSVRINTRCSYDQLKVLLREMHASNPYLSVAGLNIIGKPASPPEHDVTIRVEWPLWTEMPEVGPDLEKLGENHG